jgi:proline iminopeptidase
MARLVRTTLLLAVALTCAHCTRVEPPSSLARGDGYVDAGGGVRLFYRTVGDRGDTVVVLHGGPGLGMGYLDADLEPLAARHVLLFYDQRGTGSSTLVADSISLDARFFVADLEAVRRHFGLERLTLLGHSWGAFLAALYSERHPERVDRLLLVNPGAVDYALETQAFVELDSRRDDDARQRLAQLEATYLAQPTDAVTCRAFYQLFFAAAFVDTAAQQRSRGDFCAGTPESLRNRFERVDVFTMASLGEWDLRSTLHAIAAPALVIHGARDAVPLESARAWAMALPDARLLVLEGSGHFSYLDVPEPFFAAAHAFLRGEWPAGSEVVPRASAH